ncbi:MAG: FUSC family protein [Algicola sp.]|nr:FUSC family protein [Algicola sp.]
MNQKELSQLSNEELLKFAKDNKPSPIIDAFFIGFLIGIVVYSVVANSWGLLSLLPLFLIYVLLKKPKKHSALKKELKNRNLSL